MLKEHRLYICINVIGTVIFMVAFYIIHAFVDFPFMHENATKLGIAIVHTAFNIVATAILLPFSSLLVKLACVTVKDDKEEEISKEGEIMLLDSRFLDKPGFAIEQCKNVSYEMARISKESIMLALSLFDDYKEEVCDKVVEYEGIVDKYEDELGTYMVKLSSHDMTEEDSKTLSRLLHSIGDFERISDHALNICETAQEMHEKKISFSEVAKKDVDVFTDALKTIVNMTCDVFENDDLEQAVNVEPLEEVMDMITKKLKKGHVSRVKTGECTLELGFLLSDLITNYERVADHCSNIAVAMIQINDDGFDTHGYLDNLKHGDNKAFINKVQEYKERFKV